MSLPTYECPKVPRPIEMTGRLDDPLWELAPVATLGDARNGEAMAPQTTVRLLHDDTCLYVGYHCVDDYVWGTFTEHEDHIFSEECVELFICPSGVLHQYFEINLSPKNVRFDACILNPRTPREPKLPIQVLTGYDPEGFRTVVHVEGELDKPGAAEYWMAEYAIPFDQLIGAPHTPPQAGDEWRMNLYRIDASAPKEQRFFSWSPTGIIDFHRPWCFGSLRFGGSAEA